LRGFESAAGGFGIGITDEEDGLSFVADEAGGDVMGRGVFAHHAGGKDEQPSAGEFHPFHFLAVEHDEVEGLGQAQVAVIATGAMGLQIVDFGEDPAEPPM
jgi:hypothetical protein